jgi:hypothetical protein
MGSRYPEYLGRYLAFLESDSNWNLRRNYIYVSYSNTASEYINLSHRIYSEFEEGGEIIKEFLDVRDFLFSRIE